MAKREYYIEIDSYWQNSTSIFFGPYTSKDALQAALQSSECTMAGDIARDVRYGVRAQIHTATPAKRAGMREHYNLVAATVRLPDDTAELNDVISGYRLLEFIG